MRGAVVWTVLRDALAALAADRGDRPLHVLDAGGGTGGFAVPLAGLGFDVTVVDPSPDSLAALERRATEAGLSGAVHALQGDAAQLPELVAAQSADAVLCHSVLEVVDDPAVAMAAVASVLRPGGIASVLAAGRGAAVVGRALAGHFDEAAHALADEHGRFGAADGLARRFSDTELARLVGDTGLQVESVHGVRVFSDLVPGALLDDPSASASLAALEEAVADRPEFRALATQLHVLAVRR
ncbi:MAG: methyltransferase domain-containing protein [Actinomycetes bacterium]